MSAVRRVRPMPVLRLLVLGLLALGLLMQPVLAVACDIGDARLALAGEPLPSSQAADADSGDDCCPARSCDACCAYGAAHVPPTDMAFTASVNAAPVPRLSVQFRPRAYPVGFRPPIAG